MKLPACRVGSQERLHLTQQVRIASGGVLEERRSLLGCHRERRVIEITDLSVPLRRHRLARPLNSR